jgi:hypothetical protein
MAARASIEARLEKVLARTLALMSCGLRVHSTTISHAAARIRSLSEQPKNQ